MEFEGQIDDNEVFICQSANPVCVKRNAIANEIKYQKKIAIKF